MNATQLVLCCLSRSKVQRGRTVVLRSCKKQKTEKTKKTTSQVTPTEKQKGESIALSLGYYTALQGVDKLLKIIHWIYFTALTCDTKKVRALQTIWYAWQRTLLTVLVMFFFFAKKKKTLVRRKKNVIVKKKKKVMNLQQGHIVMQWPSQAHLHRWDELVSPDHKSTHVLLKPDIIQPDGWISGSKVAITHLPERERGKNNDNLLLEFLLPRYFWKGFFKKN